ncbi:hypothetical protein EDB86DRAFT_3064853 [Lactarius hatsudake]|nr:hypothetical protein EDB86DRAFT_3064853 [Lactarius hatsudake]
MSEPTLKRKRSLKDSTKALNCLDDLKEELDGFEETQEETRVISEHVRKLKDILEGAKKPAYDLEKIGVQGKRLVFEAAKITDLTNRLTMEANSQIVDLHARIKRLHAATGLQISHPTSGDELWLSGNVDYAIIQYEKDKNMDNYNRLLAPGGSRRYAFEIANGRLFLYVSTAHSTSSSEHLPSRLLEVRTGSFFILKSENNTLMYYESGVHRLSRDILENNDMPLREIVQLIREWVSFSMGLLIYLSRIISLVEAH